MSVIDEARKLLRLAERDLARMEAVHENEDLEDEAYGFFAQQAAEKAIKAALTFQGIAFSYTHDLVKLFDLLPPEILAGRLNRMSRHSTLTRWSFATICRNLRPHSTAMPCATP